MITQFRHGTQTPPTTSVTPPPAGTPPVTIPGFPTFNDLRYYGSCCLSWEQLEVILAWLSHFSFSSETTAAGVLSQIGINDVRDLNEFMRALVGLAAEGLGLSASDSLDLWKAAQAAGYARITQIQRLQIMFEAVSVAAHAAVRCDANITGTQDPRNVVIPTCVGQVYIDTVNHNVFQATGGYSDDWALLYHWT